MLSGNRIITPVMKRMTTEYPFNGHPEPFQNSKPDNGLTGIFGTGGVKSAGVAFYGGNYNLIEPDKGYNCFLRQVHGIKPT